MMMNRTSAHLDPVTLGHGKPPDHVDEQHHLFPFHIPGDPNATPSDIG
jgi:hypothetical protein